MATSGGSVDLEEVGDGALVIAEPGVLEGLVDRDAQFRVCLKHPVHKILALKRLAFDRFENLLKIAYLVSLD